MDVARVMLPIVFEVHAETEGDTPDIIHPEPHCHLILHLPNQALVGSDKQMIEVQNDCDKHCGLIVWMVHEQYSVDI
jgi:hypothetical protein